MVNARIFSFALFFCLVSVASFAQTLQPYSGNILGAQELLPYAAFVDDSKFSQIDVVRGSPYLYDEFIVGTIYFNGFTEVSHLPLRFNILKNEFEALKDSLIYTFAEPELIDRILLEGNVFTYINESEGHELSGFVKMWNFQFPTVVTKMRNYIVEQTYHGHLFDYTNPVFILPMRDEHYLMQSEIEGHAIRIPGLKRSANIARLAAEVSSRFPK
ncbi:MAG: hypothetical protein AAF992_02880 [Bacteroidota bacterium]